MTSRREFLKNASIGILGLAGLPAITSCSKKSKPNFLFILVDDLGWKDLGCYGSSFYETPNIDRLAAEGTQFMQAYAACPVCSPTRASIMTGKYPARMAATDWFGAPQPETAHKHWTKDKPLLPAPYEEKMALEEKTLAETFKENGYSTFFAGKWHLGRKGFWPTDQGFDINKGGWERGGPWGGGKYFSPYGNPNLSDGPEGEYLPERLANETADFIKSVKDKPFLAYLSFYSVHTPLMTTEKLEEKYQTKRQKRIDPEQIIWGEEGERKVRLVQEHAVYGGMVEAMDSAVGKVLDTLKELKLDKNTIIIFMSDNGGLSTSEGHPTSNLPLRAGKGWLYEGGIREPMIVKWPDSPLCSKKCEHPVISTDFYPTMLDMAGLPAQPQQHVDGISFAPLLKGRKSWDRKEMYWHYPHYGNQGGTPGAAVREGEFKLIEFFEDRPIELYNLKDDIGEQVNLAEKMPEKVKALQKKLHAWQKEVGARFPSPNPNAKG
jgi:arylsulfatase A-like enzyme